MGKIYRQNHNTSVVLKSYLIISPTQKLTSINLHPMFISLTAAKFILRFILKLWCEAIVATTATIGATIARITNSPKKNRFLIFVGQEFFFGHNRENPVNDISINNLDINLGYFSWAAISYRLGKDFRSGRYRCNLGLACT